MNDQKLRRQYEEDTMYMVNPPSFATWLAWQRDKAYSADALKAAADQAAGFLRGLKVE